jgi:hypothetical protein
LDLIYNYGFLSAIPFFYLITVTIRSVIMAWRNGHGRPDLLALAGLVLLLVLVGNSLTVGLRQPYAGIFTFFIWGLLLGKLGLLGQDGESTEAGLQGVNKNGLLSENRPGVVLGDGAVADAGDGQSISR